VTTNTIVMPMTNDIFSFYTIITPLEYPAA